MTLTTHALLGAAAASLFPASPALAFAAGFASHFAADALPHWDYKILSKKENKEDKLDEHFNIKSREFVLDLLRIGGDAALGTALAVLIFCFWLFDFPVWLAVLGAWVGILPDPMQFVYYKTRSKLLLPLQRFHIWVQKGKSIHPPFYTGLLYQAVVVVGALVVLTYLYT
jgi:hypothetical protein